MNMFNL